MIKEINKNSRKIDLKNTEELLGQLGASTEKGVEEDAKYDKCNSYKNIYFANNGAMVNPMLSLFTISRVTLYNFCHGRLEAISVCKFADAKNFRFHNRKKHP